MLEYEKFIESSKAFEVTNLDARMSRISHAYLFTSLDANYLKAFAEKVAGLLINLNETENVEKNIMRIKKRIHPDVKFFGEQTKIDVSVVSTIVESAEVYPFEADKKVFVLLNVNDMNEASQNKILKTIEEPPKNTYFILCATGVSKILPTILSRVKQIELDTLSRETVAELLVSSGVPKDKAEVYASCSNGDASFAEKLALDDGFLDFFNSIISCFFEINGSRDVLKFSSEFTSKTINKDEFFDVVILVCRDLSMIISGREELVICKNVISKLKVIAASLNLDATTLLTKCAFQAKKDISFNSNPTAVVDGFLFKLAEVKVKCRRL